MNSHALFKIANISKLYVAVVITKLVKDELLSLDNTCTDYFLELVGRIENSEDITLRLTVQDWSRIPNDTDNPDFWENRWNSSKDVLEYALELPVNFGLILYLFAKSRLLRVGCCIL